MLKVTFHIGTQSFKYNVVRTKFHLQNKFCYSPSNRALVNRSIIRMLKFSFTYYICLLAVFYCPAEVYRYNIYSLNNRNVKLSFFLLAVYDISYLLHIYECQYIYCCYASYTYFTRLVKNTHVHVHIVHGLNMHE